MLLNKLLQFTEFYRHDQLRIAQINKEYRANCLKISEIVETICPYCGEVIQLLVDCSVPYQEYIEDCQVCCKPMQIQANADGEGIPDLSVRSEND